MTAGGNGRSQEFFYHGETICRCSPVAIRHVEPTHFLKIMNVPRVPAGYAGNIPLSETARAKVYALF